MTSREPDIAQASRGTATTREEGAPAGAPESVAAAEEKPDMDSSVAAGEPEAPVGPVGSVASEAVPAQPDPPQTDPRQTDPPRGNAPQGNPPQTDPPQTDPPQGNQPAHTAPQPDPQQAAQPQPQSADDATDHERQLEHDLEELAAKAEKADEYLELAKRTKADFENYRKRAAREAAAAQERGVARLAKELLPAVDNLDRALEAAQSAMANNGGTDTADENGTSTLISGIKLVHDDVIAALARAGIERFSPEGERFDPQQHEAIAQQPVEGAQSGTVVEVYQRGYRLGEVVIRPARVVVAA